MSHLQYTAKSHHLQWDMKPSKQFCTLIYRQYSPKLLRERHNIKLCKTKDSSILVLLFLQVELGIRFVSACLISLNRGSKYFARR